MSEAEIRAEIDRYVCGVVLDGAEMGHPHFRKIWEVRFNDLRCADSTTSTSLLSAAVRSALDDCSGLLRLADAAYDQARAHPNTPGVRSPAQFDAAVRQAYWSAPALGPAMLSRSIHHLAESGIKCSDCRRTARPALVSLTWSEFVPHVLAHVWPHGEAASEKVFIHIWRSQDAIEALGLTSSPALDAGLIGAFALAQDEGTRASLVELDERRLNFNEARAAIAEFVDSPAAVRVVCRSVRDTGWFTGVVVTDCPAD